MGSSRTMRACAFASVAALLPLAAAFTTPGVLAPALSAGHGRLARGGGSLPLGRGLGRQGGATAAFMSATAGELVAAKALPGYHKLGLVKIAGLDANLVIGILFLLATFGVATLLFPAILITAGLSYLFDKKRRRAVDWVVHWWAKLACLFILHSPKVTGVENLPPSSEAVMYIPNHCSYLDIFTMSGFVPRPFKYVSKIEILRIPLIGWAMQFAGHIAIKRMDKRSQLQTFKDTVECLVNGNSIVTFAEGTRSKTGRLMAFKKGPIKMALKAKKRIVPVSICNLYRWMPDTAVTPLAFPRNVEIKVHPPVDTVGRNEDEILQAVFDAVNSGLPEYQKTVVADLGAASEFSESTPSSDSA